MAEVTAFAMQRDLTTFASCKENLQGLAAKIRLGAAWPGWSGDFGYEATARSLSDFEPFASIAYVCPLADACHLVAELTYSV